MEVKQKDDEVFCLTIDAGIELAEKIKKTGDHTLDFTGITIFGTPFFNGLLHTVSEFSSVDKLKLTNLPDHGRKAFDNALKNFKAKSDNANQKDVINKFIDSLKS